MWVLKTHGKTYYVNHVDCQIPWTTKETPDNSHTKGSIKIKNCKLVITSDNCAILTSATPEEIKNHNKPEVLRIEIREYWKPNLIAALTELEVKYDEFKTLTGSCGNNFSLTQIYDSQVFSLLVLKLTQINGYASGFRQLQENDPHYIWWDNPSQHPEDEDDDDE